MRGLGGLVPYGPTLALRPATAADSARLFTWRNDPHTRAMSRCTDPVSLPEHRAWLDEVRHDSRSRLLIAELDAQPVGVARLVPVGGSHQVSITVAPEARGRKLAAPLLRAVEEAARALGVVRLVAEIKPGNEASVRAFRAAGYERFALGRDGLWQCERWIEAIVAV